MTVLLFDLNPTGHHPGYIQHLIRYWPSGRGRLLAVVSADFPAKHPDIARLAAQTPGTELIATSTEETQKIAAGSSFIKRMTLEWRLMVAYAHRCRADHVLLMYLDQFQVALFTEKAPSCPVSGILFRPTLHYKTFSPHRSTWKDALREIRKNGLLRLALRNRRLQNVFCLDPYCVPYLHRFNPKLRVLHLPDPVEIYPGSEKEIVALRASTGVGSSRKILLLFGHLDGRKGLGPLTEALGQLPDAIINQLGVWLVGPLESDQQVHIQALKSLSANRSLQLWQHHQFVPDTQIQAYFGAADGVLALYQQHVGMSAVLVRAAAAEKPILSSDYGLIGQLVREKDLGLALDSVSPPAIAQAVRTFVEQPRLGNPEQMRNFARQNRASEYARVIFESLFIG